jgi:hypothetical protein
VRRAKRAPPKSLFENLFEGGLRQDLEKVTLWEIESAPIKV